MTELEQYIYSYFQVSQGDIVKISSLFQLTTLKKGEHFLESGQVCRQLCFQKSGIARVYTDGPSKEITQWISTTGYFLTDLSGLIFNQPSKYSIRALQDCEFYTLNQQQYQGITQLIPEWDYLEKLFIAKCFMAVEERVYTLLSMNAEERFINFFSGRKELFNQVPLQYLASMLAMTPETFSRLRRKLK